jgi:hypothetical protein
MNHAQKLPAKLKNSVMSGAIPYTPDMQEVNNMNDTRECTDEFLSGGGEMAKSSK